VKGRQILIAGTTDANEICLWAVDAGEIYLREMRTWECYDSGIDAAEMLIKDFYFPEVTTEQATPLLTYVIHAVSEICLDCGGPISVAIIDRTGVKQLTTEQVEATLERVKPRLDQLRKELPREVFKDEDVTNRPLT
jgi:20S proteasome alpha/beta subunit